MRPGRHLSKTVFSYNLIDALAVSLPAGWLITRVVRRTRRDARERAQLRRNQLIKERLSEKPEPRTSFAKRAAR
jgi:peptidoglycan/LPS O-acetylase OafA/YrhL